MRIVRDYYQFGAHVYVISHGRGIPRTSIAYEETPRGDGRFLWADSRRSPNLTEREARDLLEDATEETFDREERGRW